MGFSKSVFVLGLLAFFAAWMSAILAHDLKGWRSLLPVLAVLVLFVGSFILEVLVAGLEFTLAILARNLGLAT